MDAIGSVGRLMEGFAITLDTVIGQAFEDWGGSQPLPGQKQVAPRRPAAAASRSSTTAAAGKENAGAQAPVSKEPESARGAAGTAGAACKLPQQQEQQASTARTGSGSTGGRQAHITSFMSKLDAVSEQEAAEWRKRAQQLASELQRMRAQQEEYQRLRWVGKLGKAGWRGGERAHAAKLARVCPPANACRSTLHEQTALWAQQLPRPVRCLSSALYRSSRPNPVPFLRAGCSTKSCMLTCSRPAARPAGWRRRTMCSSRAAFRQRWTPPWPTQ